MERSGAAERQSHRIFIERLLIAIAIFLVLLFLWMIIDLLVLIFAAVVIAVLLRAIADPIASYTPLGNKSSAAVAVLLVVGVIVLLGYLFGSQVRAQFSNLGDIIPRAWADFQDRLAGSTIGEAVLASLEEAVPSGTNVVSRLGSVVMALGSAIADMLLITFGAIFLALQPNLYREGILQLVPKSVRKTTDDALDNAGNALRLWLLGQLVSMVIVGLLTWIGLSLVGVQSALALGLIAGFLEIIPYAGPVLAAVPGLLIALLQGPEFALYALIVYIIVQQLEGNLVTPIVQRRAVTLPPALTLFAIVAAGLLFGFVGLIFAAPLVVVVYVMVKQLYVRQALKTPTEIPGEKNGDEVTGTGSRGEH